MFKAECEREMQCPNIYGLQQVGRLCKLNTSMGCGSSNQAAVVLTKERDRYIQSIAVNPLQGSSSSPIVSGEGCSKVHDLRILSDMSAISIISEANTVLELCIRHNKFDYWDEPWFLRNCDPVNAKRARWDMSV